MLRRTRRKRKTREQEAVGGGVISESEAAATDSPEQLQLQSLLSSLCQVVQQVPQGCLPRLQLPEQNL